MHLSTLISTLINVLCWTYKLTNMINFNYKKKPHDLIKFIIQC